MADPQGPSIQDIIAQLGSEKGNATQHQKASDLLDIVKLMRDERKDAAQGAVPESLLKYIVPKSQQFHAGWEPGGVVDQMARLAGVNLGGLNGFRSSNPIPLSLLLKQTVKQPNMLEDIDSAGGIWDKLFGSPPASTHDSPAAPTPPTPDMGQTNPGGMVNQPNYQEVLDYNTQQKAARDAANAPYGPGPGSNPIAKGGAAAVSGAGKAGGGVLSLLGGLRPKRLPGGVY